MTFVVALMFSAILATSVSHADAAPQPVPVATAGAAAKGRRTQAFKDWWIWSLVAVLSAGTVVTSVVVATMPHTSTTEPAVGAPLTLTLRF